MTIAKILKFTTVEECNHMITGGLIGGKFVKGVGGLVGKALTFTTPAGTCTFTQPTDAPPGFMLFGDVKTQLEAAIVNLKVSLVDDKIAFKHATPGTAVVIGNADEPAKAVLGFKNATTLSGTAYAGASGTAPKIVDFTVESSCVYLIAEV